MKNHLRKLRNTLTLLILSLFLMPNVNFAQLQPPPPFLGDAKSFAVFTSVGALTNDGATVVTGDVGSNVGGVTGFPPGVVMGNIHDADGVSASTAPDVDDAYMYLDGILGGTVIGTTLGGPGGQTLTPDVYILGAASTLDGDLTLDGGADPNAIFIFQIDGALATTVNSTVTLINGASLCNVYWQINGAVSLGEGSVFRGTIIANGAIHLLEAASLFGRALSREGAIDLHNNIVNNELPIASIITAGGPIAFCEGGNVVLSGNNGGTWSNGETTSSITVNTSGDYFVTNTAGCGNVISNHLIITVNPLPGCAISGNSTICPGGSTQLCVPDGATGYVWNTGATTNCITVNAAGTYSVTITNANGCSSTCSLDVTVSTVTTCAITGSSIICPGGSTQLCAPAGAASYVWSTGATTNCISVSVAGNYSVTITNASGCSSTCSLDVTESLAIVCAISGNSTICPGGSTQLCATAGAAGYLWNTGATTNCITVSAAGTYSVTITNASGCSSTCSLDVAVSSVTACAITGNSTICPGGSTQLCVPAGATGYIWNTGATTNCITVNAAGTYSVTVTNANGCSSTCSQDVAVSSVTACAITGNSTICPGGSTQLCAPAGATGYVWSTGATTNCISVNDAGTYSVSITNASGCSSTCSQVVTVSPAVVCTISGNSIICPGGSTQLCVPAGAAGYLWNTGATTNCITVSAAGTNSVTITNASGCSSTCSKDIAVSSVTACAITGNTTICPGGSTQLCVPAGATGYLWNTGATTNCITVNAAGTYSVTVTNANGCSSTCSQDITVSSVTTCSITGNSSICPGGSTQLCAPAGATSYVWSTGATTNCISVNAAGTYSVTIINASGCSSTCSQIVTVTPAPICAITGKSTFCPGGSTQLCVPAGAAGYLWNTGATTNCISVSAAGTYSVTITNAGGCSSTCSKIVTVSPVITCAITGNTSICPGGSTQLCAPAGATGYVWNTGAITNCITVNAAGTYSVTLTNASGCSSTCSQVVSVIPAATCAITGSSTICPGGSTQLCVPAGATGYVWNTGATTNCITVSAAGTYSVTVTNAGGCTSTCSKIVTVSSVATCAITGSSIICPGGSTQLCVPAGGTSYIWNTGAKTNCITVSAAGTYSVTVTNAGGCTSTCSQVVTVSSVTPCAITGNSTICPGGSTQLCVPAGALKYLWSTGATTNCITVTTAGTYSVTVTNAGGCTSTCSKTILATPAPPCTITGNGTICPGGSTQLCAPAGGTSYVWNTGATTNCITVSTPGTYSVTVKNAGGCSSTCSKTIIATTAPSCTITGNSSICVGQTTQLCAPAGCVSYKWSTGATTNCITVSAAGTYSVTVTNSSGCSSTCSKTVTTTTAPSCIITGNSSICLGQSTQLCAPAGSTYKWSTGATTSCITVSAAGTYSVTVTNAGGCSSTCSKTITTTTTPSCTITGSSSICQGQSTQLCAPAGCVYYKWSTGATTSCITVSAAGTYSVTVTNAGGCSSTCSKTVTTTTAPSCTITGNSSICLGQTTQLCAPAGCAAYKWSTGATTSCITVSAAGTYSLTVTNAGGCSSTCSKTVTATTTTSCTITGNSNICLGQTTQLCAPAGYATYKWSTGATTSCITACAAGTYSVTVTNTGGCSSTCSKTVTTSPAPSCTITGNSSICQGGSTQLCAPAGCVSYKWSTGATTSCITVNATGTYSVTVTNAGGCSSTCSKTVTASTAPSCTITGNSSICLGQTTQLCAPAGCVSYKWSTGATTSCITVSAAGTYSVTVKNAGGCSSTCSKTVTASTAPSSTITGNSSICLGQTTQLCAPAGCSSYKWSTGATTSCITVSAAGTYSVTVKNSGGCSSTSSKTVTASTAPSSTITGNSSICLGQTTQLCAPAGCSSYKWSTGATTSCITVSAAGTYSVTVKNSGGCSSTSSKTVTATTAPSCTITGNLNPSGGQTTSLCAPAGCASYKWSTGATTRCITVSCTGVYKVTVTSSNGCSSSCSASVSYALSRSASITIQDKILVSDVQFKVNAYPNPFSSKAVIEFQNNKSSSHVVIEIYNITGTKMTTLFDSDVKQGAVYKVELNAGNLPSGIYTYRISTGDKIINRKIILQ